ncbi:hypothetical protein CFP56_016080 [Quercus suber]|uniref:Uncharacterized protein n=2 Tax=Quercus suber TaxID=58331 RepID=A0AAW0KP77_QUESU|nr:uncharacterized protein LOC112018001 [Quercus suber]
MADKRGLTLAHIFNPSNEDEQKEFKGVEVAISDLIRERMSKAEVMENGDILEDLECSDETFILFLKNVTFDDDKDKIEECSGITFWDLDSKVVKVRDYRVSRNFVPILEKLFFKYGDISEKSPLNLGTKTRFLNIFCGVVHSMCNTKAKDINRTLLFNWWKNFKLVQEAKFDIQFAFDHLYRFAQSLIRILREYKIDNTTFDNQMKIDDLTTELDGLKVKQEEHIRSKKGKSKLEKDILVEDFELLSKMVWTDSL